MTISTCGSVCLRRCCVSAGTIELAIPKLRAGSYFPDWLLQPRRRAEQAFVSVIADAYLAGVSTRRVEKLVQQLGVERMSKSQVSRLCAELDELRHSVPDVHVTQTVRLNVPRLDAERHLVWMQVARS